MRPLIDNLFTTTAACRFYADVFHVLLSADFLQDDSESYGADKSDHKIDHGGFDSNQCGEHSDNNGIEQR